MEVNNLLINVLGPKVNFILQKKLAIMRLIDLTLKYYAYYLCIIIKISMQTGIIYNGVTFIFYESRGKKSKVAQKPPPPLLVGVSFYTVGNRENNFLETKQQKARAPNIYHTVHSSRKA